jgi:hypothetical protein
MFFCEERPDRRRAELTNAVADYAWAGSKQRFFGEIVERHRRPGRMNHSSAQVGQRMAQMGW